MNIVNRYEKLRRDTRVLYHIKNSSKYLMTNEVNEDPGRLRVIFADKNGKIDMEGYMLGSIFAHMPDIIPDLEKMSCSFGELNPDYFDRNPVVDGLIGLAIGDAFGVPVEFLSRQEVQEIDLQDMVGADSSLSFTSGWSEIIPKGSWSDDTSMTIATMASIIDNLGQIDYDDIMYRFIRWWGIGEYSSLSFPFGLENTVSKAMERYRNGTPALQCGGTGIRDNGNGALMRMYPFSIWCILKDYNDEDTLKYIQKAAALTHGHQINAMSCFMYTLFLRECIRTRNPRRAYDLVFNDFNLEKRYRCFFSEETVQAHEILLKNNFKTTFDSNTIPESGYVVDSLAIMVYGILNTDNYEDAVKMAVSFGYDTDTNAAITGSVAGAIYGVDHIPERWLNVLKKKEELIQIGQTFSKYIRIE